MNRFTKTMARLPLASLGAGIECGCFVAVVGPSGAGKDTLIKGVQERLTANRNFIFARRIITRKSDCTEDHDSVTELEFAQMSADGAFLLKWSAHGLQYGLPGGLARDIADGKIIIANVSRAVLPDVRRRFRRHLVIHIAVAPEILADRLLLRGREDAAAQQARLARAFTQDISIDNDVTIDNSGDLEHSIAQLERTLRSLSYTMPLGL